jgi:hypothetical protein
VLRRPCTSAQGGADAVRLMRAFNMSPLLWQEAGVLGLEATVRLRLTPQSVASFHWGRAQEPYPPDTTPYSLLIVVIL